MNEVKKYRKKPVVIEAMLWDGSPEGAAIIVDWVLANGSHIARWDEPHDEVWKCLEDGTFLGYPASPGGLFIHTLEGIMQVGEGDYVIRGVQSEFYPCKPDVFAATYEEATDDRLD